MSGGLKGLEVVEDGGLNVKIKLGSKEATSVKLGPGAFKVAGSWSFGVSSLKCNQILAAPFAKAGRVLPFLVIGSISKDLPVVSRIACPDAVELWRVDEDTLELTRSLVLRHQCGPSWAACWIEVCLCPDRKSKADNSLGTVAISFSNGTICLCLIPQPGASVQELAVKHSVALPWPDDVVLSMAWSQRRAELVVGTTAGRLAFFRLGPTGFVPRLTLRHHIGPVTGLAFDPTQRFLASAAFDATFVWDLDSPWMPIHLVHRGWSSGVRWTDTLDLASGTSSFRWNPNEKESVLTGHDATDWTWVPGLGCVFATKDGQILYAATTGKRRPIRLALTVRATRTTVDVSVPEQGTVLEREEQSQASLQWEHTLCRFSVADQMFLGGSLNGLVIAWKMPITKALDGVRKKRTNRTDRQVEKMIAPPDKRVGLQFQCPACALSYSSLGGLKYHRQKRHADLPEADFPILERSHPSDSAVPRASVDERRDKLMKEPPSSRLGLEHKCPACARTYSTLAGLKYHRQKWHANEPDSLFPMFEAAEGTVLPCPHCDKSFPHKKTLNLHRRNVHGEPKELFRQETRQQLEKKRAAEGPEPGPKRPRGRPRKVPAEAELDKEKEAGSDVPAGLPIPELVPEPVPEPIDPKDGPAEAPSGQPAAKKQKRDARPPKKRS